MRNDQTTEHMIEQAELVVESLSSHSDWRSPHTARELLTYWAELADTAGGGYVGSIDEYMNDLNYRRHLGLIIEASGVELQDWLLVAVDTIDERFIRNTSTTHTLLMRNASPINWRIPERWWTRRSPLDSDLLDELRSVFANSVQS